MEHLNIAIVGGGLGGLTAAAFLLKSGHRVRVYEQASALREVGAGISLPPNAAKLIARLGLGEALRKTANIPHMGRLQNGKTGEMIQITPFGDDLHARYGEYYYQLHRADLLSLVRSLIDAVDPACIILNHRLESIEQNRDEVRLDFEGGQSTVADLIVGADGVRSRMRSLLCGPEDPRFTRFIAWRAIVPLDRLPESFAAAQSNVWIGPGRNVTYYPIRGKRLLNCVMFASDSDWTEEGWNLPARIEEIRAAYTGYHATIQTVIDSIPEDSCFQWALYDRDPIADWVAGRVALLGDAAHPMLPFLGQGASMAIEDAALLSGALRVAAAPDEALALYQQHRRDRANWVLLESRAAGERFVSPTPHAATFGKDGAMRANDLFGHEPPLPPL